MPWRELILCALCASPVVRQRESKAPTHPDLPREIQIRARGWERVSRAGLTSAADVARADAMEQLARRIGSLRISLTRRVDAFAATSDDIDRALREPFEGVTFSTPRYQPDQTCVVRARVSIDSAINYLKVLSHRYPTSRFNDRDWDRLRRLSHENTITVVGRGAPALARLPQPVRTLGGHPVWSTETRRTTGVSPQPTSRLGTPAGKLIASRLATTRARRDLTAQLRALTLPGSRMITVGSEIDHRPELAARFRDWVNHARIADRYWREDGNAVVRVEVELSSLWNLISPRRALRTPAAPVRSRAIRSREHKRRPDRR